MFVLSLFFFFFFLIVLERQVAMNFWAVRERERQRQRDRVCYKGEDGFVCVGEKEREKVGLYRERY